MDIINITDQILSRKLLIDPKLYSLVYIYICSLNAALGTVENVYTNRITSIGLKHWAQF